MFLIFSRENPKLSDRIVKSVYFLDENVRRIAQGLDFEVIYKKEILEGEEVTLCYAETETKYKVVFKSRDDQICAMVNFLKK